MEREIVIEDKEVLPDMKKRADYIKEGRELTEKIEELHEERKKLGLKAQKLQEKVQEPVEESVKEQTELSEFEYMASVRLEDEEIVVTIADQLEEIKKQLREEKEDELEAVEVEDE